MGNEIFIQDKRVCVQPLRNRLEAIQKLQPPTTVKGCRSFVGMVNFLSMFCLEEQKLLKPIYDLTRKRRPFIWGKEQYDSVEENKHVLINPQSFICLTKQVDFTCILILASSQQVVHFTKYRMENPSSLHMPPKDCQKPKKAIQ